MSDHPQAESRQENDESIASYQKLLEHDPTSQVFALVAEHLCAKGLWREAEATCRRGLVFHPHHLKGKVMLGWALRELGEADEAEHILTEAHRELSRNADLYRILADIAAGKGQGDLARHYLSVHQLLQTDLDSAIAVEPQAREELPEPQPPSKLTLMDILARLAARFDQKPVPTSAPANILTEADRQQLYEMFNFSTG